MLLLEEKWVVILTAHVDNCANGMRKGRLQNMKISSLTDIGQRGKWIRTISYSSEEAVGNLPNLFLVADGMGGHKAGEFASRFAVEAVVAAIRENQEERPVAILSQSIQRANRRLKEYADEHQQMKGMGTTIVAAGSIRIR